MPVAVAMTAVRRPAVSRSGSPASFPTPPPARTACVHALEALGIQQLDSKSSV
jgi:hypothetical protein